jgi:molecular chaperone GrpE
MAEIEKKEEMAAPEQPPVEAEAEAEVEAAPAPAPEAECEALRQELEEERQKAAETYDQWLRSVAELRNFKKRVEQEREQWAREANAGLLARLLPILDDFERAMIMLPDEKLMQFSWIEGIALIFRRLQAALEQHGLQPIEAVGKPFDPHFHEAVLYEEVPREKDQLVLSELQKGYRLRERVLRPALVKVGKSAPEPAAPAEAGKAAEQESPAPAAPAEAERAAEQESPAPAGEEQG